MEDKGELELISLGKVNLKQKIKHKNDSPTEIFLKEIENHNFQKVRLFSDMKVKNNNNFSDYLAIDKTKENNYLFLKLIYTDTYTPKKIIFSADKIFAQDELFSINQIEFEKEVLDMSWTYVKFSLQSQPSCYYRNYQHFNANNYPSLFNQKETEIKEKITRLLITFESDFNFNIFLVQEKEEKSNLNISNILNILNKM